MEESSEEPEVIIPEPQPPQNDEQGGGGAHQQELVIFEEIKEVPQQHYDAVVAQDEKGIMELRGRKRAIVKKAKEEYREKRNRNLDAVPEVESHLYRSSHEDSEIVSNSF